MSSPLTYIFPTLLDLLLPRCCPVCGKRLIGGETLVCSKCAFSYNMEGVFEDNQNNYMTNVLSGQFNIKRANALFKYIPKEGLAYLIYELKYNQRPDIGIMLGRKAALSLESSGFFDGITCVVPVPITRKRHRVRGYNQSEMLAKGISEITGIPVNTQLLKRTSFGQSQTKVGKLWRRDNVEKAFMRKSDQDLEGTHLLLVDDVFTTGSTMIQCAKALTGDSFPKGRSVEISVLTMGLAHWK